MSQKYELVLYFPPSRKKWSRNENFVFKNKNKVPLFSFSVPYNICISSTIDPSRFMDLIILPQIPLCIFYNLVAVALFSYLPVVPAMALVLHLAFIKNKKIRDSFNLSSVCILFNLHFYFVHLNSFCSIGLSKGILQKMLFCIFGKEPSDCLKTSEPIFWLFRRADKPCVSKISSNAALWYGLPAPSWNLWEKYMFYLHIENFSWQKFTETLKRAGPLKVDQKLSYSFQIHALNFKSFIHPYGWSNGKLNLLLL